MIVVKLAEQPGKDQVRDFPLPGTEGHPLVLTSLSQVVEGEMPILCDLLTGKSSS